MGDEQEADLAVKAPEQTDALKEVTNALTPLVKAFVKAQDNQTALRAEEIKSEYAIAEIDARDRQDERKYAGESEKRRTWLAFAVLGVFALVAAALLLKEQYGTVEKITLSFLSLVAGAFGGYGIGTARAEKRSRAESNE